MVVGGAVGKRLDELRRRWDPVMAARIPVHLTLVHDVVDHAAAARRVETLGGATGAVSVTLNAPALWAETPTYGVYLGIDDPAGAVAELHRQLADLEAPRWARVPYRPHVTLVHGRTVDPGLAEPAWRSLRQELFDVNVQLVAIDVMELLEPDGWSTVQSVRLSGGSGR